MRRVLSIPSAHPYAARVLPHRAPASYPGVPESTPTPARPQASAARLPDPVPGEGPARPDVWWPHRGLDAAWVDEHAADIDAVHLHFGFEGRTLDELDAWLDALDRHGLPLVLTVHDLQNPHLGEQTHHDATLDRLVPRAARLLTLTDGAADEVEKRWGTRPLVVRHPQVVDDETILASRRPAPTAVGMHLGSVRAGTDPRPWIDRLAAACAQRGLRLDVVASDELRDPATRDEHRSAVITAVESALTAAGLGPVRFVPRMSDAELHAWVGGLAVAVLPYRHGTHSGWLEMCWDLGVPVLTPLVGHLADQHDEGVHTFGASDGAGLEQALDSALAEPRSDPRERLQERRALLAEVVATHEALYDEVTR